MGSRGATCIAWDEPSGLLAVAVKRRIVVYALVGSDLVQKGEHSLQSTADAACCMVWAGGSYAMPAAYY